MTVDTAATQPFLVMAKPVGPICNLDCGYCYYLGKKTLFPRGERFRMRPEVLETYVAQYIAASPGPLVHFVWHGGEPTLAGIDFYRRVVELQARHLPEGWRCLNSLQTNGTLLDDAWGAFLAEHGFLVGLSLDGPPPLHDAGRVDRRGRPTSDRALRGLRTLRAHGIDPEVLCTLHAGNAGHPLEVYRFFLDLGISWIQFIPVVRRDADGHPDRWSVSPEEMGDFLCSVFDEWIRYDLGRIGVQNFLEPFLVAKGQPANLCVMSETCGRALALEHDGSVYACDHFVDAHHRLGSIGTEDLRALVDAPAQRAFGAAKRHDLPDACLACDVRRFCHGGCPKDRLASGAGGEPGLNFLCAGYQRFYRHVSPYLARMAALVLQGHPVTQIAHELETAERDERRRWRTASRNGPCPCGSGEKYKRCCLGRRRL
jgi:uncharacterized protein